MSEWMPFPGSFDDGVLFCLGMARHWGLLLGRDHDVCVINWRFEDNEVDGDPGFVLVEPTDDPPGDLSVQNCTFVSCSLNVVDTLIDMINEAVPEDDE